MELVGCRTVAVVLLFCVSSIATEDTNDLLNRLETTEQLLKILSDKVHHLESRDKQQQKTIEELKQQLQRQQDVSQSEENFVQEPNKKTSKVSSLSQLLVRSIQRKRQASIDTPVAFFARLGNHLDHAGINQVFIFDNVETNIGNAYNTNMGMFTAPVDGIYVFSTTLVSKHHVNAHASFYRNSNSLNTMYVSGAEAGYDTTSATITLYLSQGDIITVRNGDSNVSYYGYNHTSFTGFLLNEYSAGGNIVG
ncbi:hypothetical protein ACF0H5_012622 [Mactra antiquata]